MGAESNHSWIDDEISASRLFILGAGFSAGADVPLTANLLEIAMTTFRRECPGIFTRIDGRVRDYFGLVSAPDYGTLDFSEFCTFLHYLELSESGGKERWTDTGSRENLGLRYFLAKTIAWRTPRGNAIPKIYLDFARELQPRDFIITFNWDCLLESALDHIARKFTYTFEPKKIKIVKPHGSVNWRIERPAARSFRWKSMRSWRGALKRQVWWCRELLDRSAWSQWSAFPDSEIQPCIVMPGFAKALDVRSVAPLWYKPEFAFLYTNDVYVIGLGLANDDFIVKCFLRHNLPRAVPQSEKRDRRVFVINPDPTVREKYDFVSKCAHVEFRVREFGNDDLDLINSRQIARGHGGVHTQIPTD